MKCSRCGTENAINRLYCDECGAELEHDLSEIQASVDKEVRQERQRATARAIRWLLGVSIIVFFAGFYFRRAYKDLPENDIVAFIPAPAVEMGDVETVTTPTFGVALPEVKPHRPPRMPRDDGFAQAVSGEAYLRAAVVVRHPKAGEPVTGLLVGDLVLEGPVAGGGKPVAVHVADLRSLRPLQGGAWEIAARGLEKPVQITLENAERLKLEVLAKGADAPVAIPLKTLQDIRPAHKAATPTKNAK